MDNRLKYIAEIIIGYKRIIDIGTDHGYLPIYLIENGIVDYAIVSDISKFSLRKAENLIKQKKLEDKIESRVGDGLKVLKKDDDIDAIVIAGMGGNLITDIIDEKKDFIKKNNITLILQPMQNPEVLRKYLLDNNFSIKSHLVEEEKIYQIIECKKIESYSLNKKYSNIELEIGKKCDYQKSFIEFDLYKKLINFKINQIENIIINVKESSTTAKDDIIVYNEEKLQLLKKYLES